MCQFVNLSMCQFVDVSMCRCVNLLICQCVNMVIGGINYLIFILMYLRSSLNFSKWSS